MAGEILKRTNEGSRIRLTIGTATLTQMDVIVPAEAMGHPDLQTALDMAADREAMQQRDIRMSNRDQRRRETM